MHLRDLVAAGCFLSDIEIARIDSCAAFKQELENQC